MRVFSQIASNIVIINGWADFSPTTLEGCENLDLLAQEAGEVLEICNLVVLFNLREALMSTSEEDFYSKTENVTPSEARAILDLARIVGRVVMINVELRKWSFDADQDSVGVLFNLNTGRSAVFKIDYDHPGAEAVHSKLTRRLSAKAGGITI